VCEFEGIDFLCSEYGGSPAQAQRLVANETVNAPGIEFCDVGSKPLGCSGAEFALGAVPCNEQLLLNTGYGSPRIGGCFSDFGGWRGAFRGPYADSTNAICTVTKKQTEIIFCDDMCYAGLLFPEPSFRPQVLEKWMKPLCPFVFTTRCWKTASDVVSPVGLIGKARPTAGSLYQCPRSSVLKENFCRPKHRAKLYLAPPAQPYGLEL
jgi:hypothetical protein